ncbi:MAG: hypothetical protein JSS95_06990 [Acidobacteria bacterium]|nr:hypothetical protein [Acidobacteriota bacterium]
MTGTRVMPGLENLTGRTIGTLRVGEMVERHPQPRYTVACSLCAAQSTESQSRLTSGAARCRNGGCGRPQRPSRRELLTEQRRQTAERDAQRLAEDREASERRMAAECEADGWERPTKYAPTPTTHQVMTARERLELKARREAEELERIEADRSHLEAERKAAEAKAAAERREHERNEKQRAYWSEWVQNDRDPKLFVSDAMRTASMSPKEADAFNEVEVKKFIADTHEYQEYKTPGNAERILDYLSRNGVRIVDSETLHAAFVRLRDLGILEKKPTPQPVEQPRRVNLNVTRSKPQPSGPKVYIGRDYATGLDRELTQREVDRMSSTEYARAFPVAKTIFEWLKKDS